MSRMRGIETRDRILITLLLFLPSSSSSSSFFFAVDLPDDNYKAECQISARVQIFDKSVKAFRDRSKIFIDEQCISS